jgi:hypothetical protein
MPLPPAKASRIARRVFVATFAISLMDALPSLAQEPAVQKSALSILWEVAQSYAVVRTGSIGMAKFAIR